MWPNLQFAADLVTFTEEILNGKLYFFVQCIPSTRPMVLEQYRTILDDITRTMIYTFSADIKPFRADGFRYSAVITVVLSAIKSGWGEKTPYIIFVFAQCL